MYFFTALNALKQRDVLLSIQTTTYITVHSQLVDKYNYVNTYRVLNSNWYTTQMRLPKTMMLLLILKQNQHLNTMF